MYPIPANATRIRYLESTGTQYIDTGYVPSTDSVVAVNGSWTYRSTSSSDAMQQGVVEYATPSNRQFLFCNQTNNLSFFAFGSNGYISNNPLPSASNYYLNAPSGVVKINSSSFTISPSYGFTGSFHLFKRNCVGFATPPGDLHCKYRLTSATFAYGSTLVRSFVPVRVGQVGYLFDRVSGQLFGNSGTGDFVLGPDTFSQGVVPTRMMAMGVRRKRQPSYLQANGIVWIDTGVPFTTNYTARCRFQFVSGRDAALAPFGFWYDERGADYAGRIYWRPASSDWRYQYPKTTAYVFGSEESFPFDSIHESEIGPSGVKMDGVILTITQTSFTSTSYTQHLFGLLSYNNHYGTGEYGHQGQSESSVIRIWSASWTDGNGVLVRDFIPAEQNGQAGMFDRVTQTFFGPATGSTGTFFLGYD